MSDTSPNILPAPFVHRDSAGDIVAQLSNIGKAGFGKGIAGLTGGMIDSLGRAHRISRYDEGVEAAYTAYRRARGTFASPASVNVGDRIGGWNAEARDSGGSWTHTGSARTVIEVLTGAGDLRAKHEWTNRRGSLSEVNMTLSSQGNLAWRGPFSEEGPWGAFGANATGELFTTSSPTFANYAPAPYWYFKYDQTDSAKDGWYRYNGTIESGPHGGPPDDSWQALTLGTTITYDVAVSVNATVASVGAGQTIAAPSNTGNGKRAGQLKIQGGTNWPSFAAAWDFGADGAPPAETDNTLATIVSWVEEGSDVHAVFAEGFQW